MVCLCLGLSYANIEVLLGMPNTRNVFFGMIANEKYGAFLRHSVLINDPDMSINIKQQYARLGLLYQWLGGELWRGYYIVYGGMRYDNAYWDMGTMGFAVFGPRHGVNLETALEHFYDSEMGNFLGYLMRVRSPELKKMSVFVGFKNIPEYRMVERRVSGGVSIGVDGLSVNCEVSSPTSWETQFTRVSIDFVYRFSL